MKLNTRIIIVICLLSVMLLYNGCSSKNEDNGLKLGTYRSTESKFSWVSLAADNKFIITFNFISSYIGIGDYSVVDNKLILNDIGIKDKPKQYIFKIDGDSLTFESGEYASKFFKQGTVFKLVQEKK